MSGSPADHNERPNLAELVARIERQQAETRKFVAESDKLRAGAGKLHCAWFFVSFVIGCVTMMLVIALALSIIRAACG